MRVSRLTAPVLALLLLLSSTAGLVAHDHATAIDRDAVACTIDHERVHDASAGAEIAAAGEHHAHDCVGCHFAGKRSLHAAGSGVFRGLGSDIGCLGKPVGFPRPTLSWTGRTLRGPPRV